MYDQTAHIDSGKGRVQIPEDSGERDEGKDVAKLALQGGHRVLRPR